ncbi:hypothetical protein MKZ38_000659 [Zalerion maritima]|uniref:Uncharacterized protein n=1 Tax=Zalerion maritima TaxID=339359 RepID=A0AAD5WTK4_9PEZI|nr:hypothetical protein MKZ38_000659 [Zalerion maritima]
MADQARGRLGAIGNQLKPVKTMAPPSTEPRVRDKVIIVTGTNSLIGIGRASAEQFAQNGAKALYLCDYDDSNLAAINADLTSKYPDVEIHTRRFDAAEEAGVTEVVGHAISTYGRLDVFFANAGVSGAPVSFLKLGGDDFMNTMRTNALSVFLATKIAAPAMMMTSNSKPEGKGSIVATASVAGLRSNAGPTAYSASKAAVVSMAQTMSYQLSGTGVRINAICPGLIETGMTAPAYERARARGSEKRIGQLNPTQRGGKADEIARVALFLGSDESSYVNGQAWAVDGGLSSGHPYVPGRLA